MKMKPLFFWAAWAALLVGAGQAAPQKFFVAPAPVGNDAHAGSADAPFASIERARQAVRAHLASPQATKEVVVEIRSGLYELAAPVRFEAADSGLAGGSVTYRAAAGEAPVLSGGRRVTGWTKETEGVFHAEVGREVDFRQLWIEGRRAIRARTPNEGAMWKISEEKKEDGFDLPSEAWRGVAVRPNEIEVSVLVAWMHKRLRVARVDAGEKMARVVIAPGEWDGVTNQPQGDRVYLGRNYWLENAREFLDASGEFFLDRTEGVLRYRPRDGENLASATVVRPELEHIIVLAGTPAAPVQRLRFEGLSFVHTGWTRPNAHGFVDVQANSLVPADLAAAVDPQYRHTQRKDRIPAAFQATTADEIVVRGCRFGQLGGAGVMFTGGGNDNVVEGNSFVDLAAGGIEFGEDAARPADARVFPRRNRIANNFIAHIGQDYFGSVAILGYYTDASLITHNEITAVPYTAISQGWGWGNPTGPDDARANRITHNHVTNFMRRLDDGGGIYTTDRQLGSEIAHNYVARMTPPDAHTKAGGAIYPDQFTEGYAIHHNVVAEALRWLFIWNPNIRHNRVTENFADTTALRNDGADNVVEPVNLVADRRWPDAAAKIIAAAGLEPRWAHVREFAAAREIWVECTSEDFQGIAGEWVFREASAESTESGGAAVAVSGYHSTDAVAQARWLPLVPRSGEYEVRVWRPTGAGGAAYEVRTDAGVSEVTLAESAQAGWSSLGIFAFAAGAGAEIRVRRSTGDAESKPLVACALGLVSTELPPRGQR